VMTVGNVKQVIGRRLVLAPGAEFERFVALPERLTRSNDGVRVVVLLFRLDQPERIYRRVTARLVSR
jgi:hypothetical protein